MGFFSSRDKEHYHNERNEKSPTTIIRSRFYGKNKGKEREKLAPLSLSSSASSAPPASFANTTSVTPSSTPKPAPARPPADTITMNLTQRLNELATANAQGLLDDDEYRMLRQNLFERFSGATTVPTEMHIVPIGSPSPRKPDVSNHNNAHSHTSSSLRSPSVRSKSSITSGLSDVFRRNPGRHAHSTSSPAVESSSSIFSGHSSLRRPFSRVLGRKTSDASIDEGNTTINADSLPSRKSGELGGTLSRSSTHSKNRLRNPPSAFALKIPTPSSHALESEPFPDDDDELLSSKEIRRQIQAVEAESRHLADAFHGLELSVQTKRRSNSTSAPRTPIRGGSAPRKVTSPRAARERSIAAESDATSMRSFGSAAAAAAAAVSSTPSQRIRALPSHATTSSIKSPSLHRKNSLSSLSSRGKHHIPQSAPAGPPPPLPWSVGSTGAASSSSINLSTSRSTTQLPLSLTTVSEDGRKIRQSGVYEPDEGMEEEMAEIQARKAEVIARYDARLEYLRAKLKGAELHEKSMDISSISCNLYTHIIYP